MNELRVINSGDLWRLFPMAPTGLLEFAVTADPLYLWSIECVPACLLGLTPVKDQPNVGYIWGWNTPLVSAHPVAYALTVQRLVKEQLKRYPILIGHCTQAKIRWVESFGGQLYDKFGEYFNFKIEVHS